ncbi:MAG: type II toxin-antitoxin system RelE/ParE family toxin [Planctomycetota bacterium]
MMRLLYRESALADIEGVLDHIEFKLLNPAAAYRLGEGLLATCEMLETHPELGVRRDDLQAGLRVFSHRGYGIYYSIDAHNRLVKIDRVFPPLSNVTPDSFR